MCENGASPHFNNEVNEGITESSSAINSSPSMQHSKYENGETPSLKIKDKEITDNSSAHIAISPMERPKVHPVIPVENRVSSFSGETETPASPTPLFILDLIYWRHPLLTVFVLSFVVSVEVGLKLCSVISVISYSGLFILAMSLVFRVYAHFFPQNTHPLKTYLEIDLTISRERTEEVSRKILNKINALVLTTRDLIFINNYFESFKLGLVLYMLTYVGARFNFLTLCMLATIIAFTVPKMYQTHKTTVDDLVASFQEKAQSFGRFIQAKVEALPIMRKGKERQNN